MILTLIRHGETEGNKKRLYYGSADLPLLDESFCALRRIALSGGYPKAERYYTSGMLRAEQTFEAIYGTIAHTVVSELREMDFGDFEMRGYDELKNDPAYVKWITGDNEANICPNGESGVIVTKRAKKALDKIVGAGESAVVVTHGGVIGGVMLEYFPDMGTRFDSTPQPGSGFMLEFQNGSAVRIIKKVPIL